MIKFPPPTPTCRVVQNFCGSLFLRIGDFFVFYGENVSGNFQYLRELIFVTWVPEDIFFHIDTGLFHLRYFENGPLEPGYYFCGLLKKSQKFPATRQPRSQGSLVP